MKVDQEYLRKLLTTFLDAPRSFVDLSDFKGNDISVDDTFLFHMQILEDQAMVECLNGEKELGYIIAIGGNFEWISKPLRLTASGHEFAEALARKEIFIVLKSGFKNASISTLREASKELLSAFVKKQTEKYIG